MSAPRISPRAWALSAALAAALAAASACETIQQGLGTLTEAGKAGGGQTAALIKAGEALRDSFSDLTEEEEYYIGRSVSAIILGRYPVYSNESLTRYVNLVGNSVALFSPRPEIYAGWHFLILDSDEVNALAAPGGMIFVTKGLLRLCKDEEMLGLVLAHEIGHVAAKHGLQSIKKSRLVEAFKILGAQAVQKYGPQELAQLTGIFEDVLGDVVGALVERGYDRKLEYEADGLAVRIGAATGYDPTGITRFLEVMAAASSAAAKKGWFQTHPTPEQRVAEARTAIAGLSSVPKPAEVRSKRFRQAFAGLK